MEQPFEQTDIGPQQTTNEEPSKTTYFLIGLLAYPAIKYSWRGLKKIGALMKESYNEACDELEEAYEEEVEYEEEELEEEEKEEEKEFTEPFH